MYLDLASSDDANTSARKDLGRYAVEYDAMGRCPFEEFFNCLCHYGWRASFGGNVAVGTSLSAKDVGG